MRTKRKTGRHAPTKGKKPRKRSGKAPRGGKSRDGWLNRSAIAAKLGLDRRTVNKYLAMEGAPPADGKHRHEFAAARVWIEKNAARVSSGTEEMKRIRESILRMEAEDKAIDLAVKRGLYVEKKKIEPTIATFMTQLTENLRNKFELELPPKYEGQDQVGRAKLNADAIDWVMRKLKDGTLPITK